MPFILRELGITNNNFQGAGEQACYVWEHCQGPPRVFGNWREMPFIFRELGSTGNYFLGAGEQVINYGEHFQNVIF